MRMCRWEPQNTIDQWDAAEKAVSVGAFRADASESVCRDLLFRKKQPSTRAGAII